MADEVSLPPTLAPNASLDEIRAAVASLMQWAAAREPVADGSTLEKFLTGRAAVAQGLLSFAGDAAQGPTGDILRPGNGTSNPGDSSQPTPVSGLAVAAGVASLLVSIDSPNYPQGGGNGRTIIYKANYSGSGPLPTFSDAVQAGIIPGKGVLLLLSQEPGVQARFWAKAETRHPTLQANPTGGINGVGATATLIENQHIGSLSVSKLIAGSIGVSEYIQSTGYTGSGVSEWRIDGNGVARFTGVIVSGTIVATAGSIGGITINATDVRSTNYVAATSGFRITNAGAAEFYSVTINGGGLFTGNVTGQLAGTAAATVLSDIAARLRRDTNEILGAVMTVDTVASPAGFRAGTLTWNAAGAYVSGSGVAMTPLGLVGYNGATPTFSINASTGAATFGGALTAATGTLGALTIASGGYIRSANYVAETSGFTIESSGKAEFASLVVRNASGNVMLNALATGAAAPPWVVGASSVGGGVDLTTGLSTDGAIQLRSMIAAPGIAIGYTSTGAVQIGVTSPLNDEVQLAADETTTTVGITPANMTLPLLANTTYVIRGRLMVKSALATTGHVLGCNVPSGAATVLRVTAQATQSTAEQRVLNLPSGASGTVVFTDHFAATQAAPTVFDANSFSIMEFEASVLNGSTAGVFELVFGSGVPGSSVTLRAGSSMTGQALKAGVATAIGLAGAPAYTTPIDAVLYRGNSRSALATATFSVLRDGTWATSRTGGASTSGNWAATPSANVGLQWQVRFVPTAGTLTSNGAAEWTTIGATFTASLTAFSPTGSGTLTSSTCTVQIRFKNILTGTETTAGTVVLNAEAQSDSDEYNP